MRAALIIESLNPTISEAWQLGDLAGEALMKERNMGCNAVSIYHAYFKLEVPRSDAFEKLSNLRMSDGETAQLLLKRLACSTGRDHQPVAE